MSTPVAFIFVCTILFGPFFLIDYKHWRNARAAEKIFHEAKPKFEQECERLGIRADLEFCDLYTSSFIRCDHVTERIAVYAGKTNRFAIIPYKDYFAVIKGVQVGGEIPAGNGHYVTTQIGNTSVTTEYKSQGGVYIGGYTPEIHVIEDSKPGSGHAGFHFDGTDVIGYRRFQLTKNFCEEVRKGMDSIGSYAFQFPYPPYKENDPRTNFLRWCADRERRAIEQANKPDKYGTHSI